MEIAEQEARNFKTKLQKIEAISQKTKLIPASLVPELSVIKHHQELTEKIDEIG